MQEQIGIEKKEMTLPVNISILGSKIKGTETTVIEVNFSAQRCQTNKLTKLLNLLNHVIKLLRQYFQTHSIVLLIISKPYKCTGL
jgi:hypothetical protein